MKSIVIYYSQSGNTRKIAKAIHNKVWRKRQGNVILRRSKLWSQRI